MEPAALVPAPVTLARLAPASMAPRLGLAPQTRPVTASPTVTALGLAPPMAFLAPPARTARLMAFLTARARMAPLTGSARQILPLTERQMGPPEPEPQSAPLTGRALLALARPAPDLARAAVKPPRGPLPEPRSAWARARAERSWQARLVPPRAAREWWPPRGSGQPPGQWARPWGPSARRRTGTGCTAASG